MPYIEWFRPVYGLTEFWNVNAITGAESPHSTYEREISRDYGFKEWVRTPGYKTKLKLHQLPMNAFTYRRTREMYVSNGVRILEYGLLNPVRTQWFQHERGAIQTFGSYDIHRPTPDQIYALSTKAATAARLAVKSQKVNLGQVFGERKQTARLLGDTARRVVDAVVAVKHGSFNKAAKALGATGNARQHRKLIRDLDKDPARAVASAWLELQYGWRPLLDDVYGSAEAVAKADLREVHERVSKKTSMTQAFSSSGQDYDGRVYWNGRGFMKYSIKYVMYFTVPNEFYKTLGELGITNPASVAWELVPWSFVVDWFLPIGNWISSWDAVLDLVFVKGSVTEALEYESSWNGRGSHNETSYDYVEQTYTGAGSLTFIEIKRSPLSGWPMIAVPQMKNPVSGDHVKNLMALLATSFKTVR